MPGPRKSSREEKLFPADFFTSEGGERERRVNEGGVKSGSSSALETETFLGGQKKFLGLEQEGQNGRYAKNKGFSLENTGL